VDALALYACFTGSPVPTSDMDLPGPKKSDYSSVMEGDIVGPSLKIIKRIGPRGACSQVGGPSAVIARAVLIVATAILDKMDQMAELWEGAMELRVPVVTHGACECLGVGMQHRRHVWWSWRPRTDPQSQGMRGTWLRVRKW
jgi:hypothetical protein